MGTHSKHSHFIPPLWVYLAASCALFFLTAFTVVTSRMHLGAWEMPVALTIASAKALVVLLIFMGLIWERSVIPAVVVASLVFIFIFISITLSDVVYRGQNNIEMSADNVHSLRPAAPTAKKH